MSTHISDGAAGKQYAALLHLLPAVDPPKLFMQMLWMDCILCVESDYTYSPELRMRIGMSNHKACTMHHIR